MPTVEDTAVALGNPTSDEFRRATEVLGKVGLTQYEARAYIALVARGRAARRRLRRPTGIPRTSAYKVLESLAEKGYTKPTGGKPILFRPTPPLDVAESLKGAIQEVFDRLANLHRLVADTGSRSSSASSPAGRRSSRRSASSWTSRRGRSSSRHRRRGGRGRPRQEDPARGQARGPRFTFVTAPLQRVPEGVEYVARDNLLATEALADGEHALLAAPGWMRAASRTTRS